MSRRKFCFNYNLSLSSMYWTTLIAINLFEQERQLMKFASCPEVHLYLASKVSRILKSIRVYHLVDRASCYSYSRTPQKAFNSQGCPKTPILQLFLTLFKKWSGGVGWGYLRPHQLLDHPTLIMIAYSIFSMYQENTKTIHLIMMIWLFSFIISNYKLASGPPKDPGGSKKILSKSRI